MTVHTEALRALLDRLAVSYPGEDRSVGECGQMLGISLEDVVAAAEDDIWIGVDRIEDKPMVLWPIYLDGD